MGVMIAKNISQENLGPYAGVYSIPIGGQLDFDLNKVSIVGWDLQFKSDIKAEKIAIYDGGQESTGDVGLELLNKLNREAVTQFEKNDKDLKLARIKQAVDPVTGEAVLSIFVPGEPQAGDARLIEGGQAWFSSIHEDDSVTKVEAYDTYGITGNPPGTKIKAYSDDEQASSNEGWYICKHNGFINLETMGGYGELPATFELRITMQKGGVAPFSGNAFVNIKWGKRE